MSNLGLAIMATEVNSEWLECEKALDLPMVSPMISTNRGGNPKQEKAFKSTSS